MTGVLMKAPQPDEFFHFYKTYINLVPSGDLFRFAEQQIVELRKLSSTVTEEVALRIHTPYTWTIKQVVGHMIDTERIFANRLHRFACGDLQPLPGMDQEPYVANCDYETPSIESLVEELCCLRLANVCLMKRLRPDQWNHRGVASGHPVTVRALGFMMVGHVTYHLQIIEKRLSS